MQTQCKYSIEDDDNVELALAHLKNMQNILESKTSAIDKTVLSTKAMIVREESNFSVRKVWVLQYANIRQIATDTKRPMIS